MAKHMGLFIWRRSEVYVKVGHATSGLSGDSRPKAFILCLLGARVHSGAARDAGSTGTLSPGTFSSGGASMRHVG